MSSDDRVNEEDENARFCSHCSIYVHKDSHHCLSCKQCVLDVGDYHFIHSSGIIIVCGWETVWAFEIFAYLFINEFTCSTLFSSWDTWVSLVG